MTYRAYYRNLIVLLAAVTLAFPAVAQGSPSDVQKLRSLIDKATDLSDAFDELPRAAIDAGPAALPMLGEILAHGHDHKDEIAAFAMAYIGGETDDYVLLKDGAKWVVQSVFFTWIS